MVEFGRAPGTVLRRQQPLAGRVELWLETATQEPDDLVIALRSTREPSMPPTFAALGVPAHLCARLDELGITEPFPVQAATVPDGLAGRDVCGKAPTGSGKTIAFGLPLLARIEKAAPRRPKGLVLVPTRELASQVQEQLQALCWGTKTEVLAVYGGAGMERQMQGARQGRRDRRRHPRPPQGPARPRLAAARRRQPRRHRRGRPHGRHGLPPRGAAPARPDQPEAPDDAVLRHARRRRRRADPQLPDQPRPPRGALDGGAGRGHPPLLGRVARRSHPGGHRRRRAVVAGHRVQPHPPRRRAPVEAAAEGRHARRGHPRRPQPEPARAGAGASSGAATCTCWSPPTWPPAASTSTASPACCSSTRRPPTRTTSTAPAAPGAPARRAR